MIYVYSRERARLAPLGSYSATLRDFSAVFCRFERQKSRAFSEALRASYQTISKADSQVQAQAQDGILLFESGRRKHIDSYSANAKF